MMAEDWGTPPWIIEEDCPLEWFYRWDYLKGQVQAKEKREMDKLNGR